MSNDITHKEGLEIISKMINEAKKEFTDDGFFYLIWGWLVLIACLSHYFLLEFTEFEKPFMVWPALMAMGGIISGIYGSRMAKKEKVKTWFSRAMKYLWGAIGISLMIVLFSSVKVGFETSYPMILVLYGIGSFVSGGLISFRPLILGGVYCWLASIAAFYFDEMSIQLLILASAILIAYIIPGQLLKSRSNELS